MPEAPKDCRPADRPPEAPVAAPAPVGAAQALYAAFAASGPNRANTLFKSSRSSLLLVFLGAFKLEVPEDRWGAPPGWTASPPPG